MMGGAGHMQDMINKIKQNRALRASQRREMKKKITGFSSTSKITQLKFKKVSAKELDSINKRNRLSIKRDNIRANILTGLIGIPIVIVMIYYAFAILEDIFR